jgi:hypothetical protein
MMCTKMLLICLFAASLLFLPRNAQAQWDPAGLPEMVELHKKATTGIDILPGQWRPHYLFEQIAWVRPSWGGNDFIWLDFPEAIFTDHGLLFLSHVNPGIVSVYPELPKVAWRAVDGGIAFDRTLPNGVRFGGVVRKASETKIALSLYIENGMTESLGRIKLQTCAFLNGIKEFSELTHENKFIHVAKDGWIPFAGAHKRENPDGKYMLGWRSGPKVADWPIMIARSREAERWVGMTWYDDTLSLIGNSAHPCLHADPHFPDLAPGERAEIQGSLLFFEGSLDAFTKVIQADKPGLFK